MQRDDPNVPLLPPFAAGPAMATTHTTRTLTFGVRPGSRATALRMHGQLDACRFTWNAVLADCRAEYAAWLGGVGSETASAFSPAPSRSRFSLSARMKPLRAEHEWLSQYSYHVTRDTLKRQSAAWHRFFSGQGGYPRFQSRHRDGQSFTIPQDFRLEDGRLRIPRIGWVELTGWDGRRSPHLEGRPTTATLKYELGRWYATVTFAVEDVRPDNGRCIGVDLNTAHAAVATSAGDVLPYPAHLTRRHEVRARRYARMMARRKRGSNRRRKARGMKARAERKVARIRKDWQHQTTTAICRSAGAVAVEDLRVAGMTRKGRGKRAVNREFLRVGPAAIRSMLDYKAAVCVAVPPAYTSRTCHACGVLGERSGAVFKCGACGYRGHADVNAARNIESAGGLPASGRLRAAPLGGPVTRQYGLDQSDG